MSMTPGLCLGTAQFGFAYGITNRTGQISINNATQILAEAHSGGVSFLDTAQAYGEAEEVLGQSLNGLDSFKIVSKIQPQNRNPFFSLDDKTSWEKDFFASLEKLNQEKIYSLLLHSSSDLNKQGSEYLVEWLISLRDRGLVQRIGLSIYDTEELGHFHSNVFDMVQIPLSLYDQRFVCGNELKLLRDKGIAIHARSIFLQGLLLAKSTNEWPHWADTNARNHHNRLIREVSDSGTSLLRCCLSFIQNQPEIEAAVVGVSSLKEMKQLISSWNQPTISLSTNWSIWDLSTNIISDPRAWPK